MNSKQALEILFEILRDTAHTSSAYNYRLKLLNVVEKDLEMLEILQDKLAEYKALEEQGQLIKLPCKKGDKIYIVNFPYISTDEIEKISVTYEGRTEIINEYQIGTYAFFTHEEAEAFLKQIKDWLRNE